MSNGVEVWSDRKERAAQNQALFRSVNEQIKKVDADFGLTDDFGPIPTAKEWVCECANASCMARITLKVEEYESVRGAPHRFAVAPDEQHVFPDVEEVTERHPNYWVVEKTGAARKVAESLYQGV